MYYINLPVAIYNLRPVVSKAACQLMASNCFSVNRTVDVYVKCLAKNGAFFIEYTDLKTSFVNHILMGQITS